MLGTVDEPAEIDAYGPRAEHDLHPVERHAELLGRDLRHRGPRARADVLHRRDHRHAAVLVDAHEGVRRRAPTAEPDLAPHSDAPLPGALAARAHLMPPLPVRLREPVALHEVLGRERAAVRLGIEMVDAAQLQRIDVELRGELVEQALEPERPLDESRRAEGRVRRRIQLRAVLDDAHVVARVEVLHRPTGHRREAGPADGVDELAAERRERPVGLRAGDEPLDGRVAVAGGRVLLASRERAPHRLARALRELGADVRVVAGPVLRAEAAAHELAHDAHVVGVQPELPRERVADAPDELRGDPDVELLVAAPLADRLVSLHRVVEDGLRAVLGLDDHVRVGQAALEVAALVAPRLLDELAASDRLVRVEQRLELLPLDLDQLQRLARLPGGVRGDGGDRLTRVRRLVREHVDLAGTDDCAHAGCRASRLEVDLLDAGARVRAAEHRGVQHPVQPDVGGVRRQPAGALEPVLARSVTADDLERPLGPLVEHVLLDHDPGLLVPALDLLLGLDQSRQVRIASSILGYAPQRQMFPAM
jgi:hypothetical protein